MKCDELRDFEVVLSTEYQFVGGVVFRSKKFYSKDSVDEAIDELKAENERLTIDKRNAELRADVADATTEKLKAKNRKLQRALYKALANWARFAVAFFSSYATKERWHKMENKCRAKAEEYK